MGIFTIQEMGLGFSPQSLDCPVSPLEFGLLSLLPSSKFCVFLLKIFNVLGFPCSFINNIRDIIYRAVEVIITLQEKKKKEVKTSLVAKMGNYP